MAGLLSADGVAATMRRWSTGPAIWGQTDCCAAVLAYARARRGITGPWPLRYRTARGAALAMGRAGGMVALAGLHLAQIGCVPVPVDQAVRGDVAILDIEGVGPAAAICLGGAWAVKGDGHVTVLSAPALAVWRV